MPRSARRSSEQTKRAGIPRKMRRRGTPTRDSRRLFRLALSGRRRVRRVGRRRVPQRDERSAARVGPRKAGPACPRRWRAAAACVQFLRNQKNELSQRRCIGVEAPPGEVIALRLHFPSIQDISLPGVFISKVLVLGWKILALQVVHDFIRAN